MKKIQNKIICRWQQLIKKNALTSTRLENVHSSNHYNRSREILNLTDFAEQETGNI